jgi:hypothetical protein
MRRAPKQTNLHPDSARLYATPALTTRLLYPSALFFASDGERVLRSARSSQSTALPATIAIIWQRLREDQLKGLPEELRAAASAHVSRAAALGRDCRKRRARGCERRRARGCERHGARGCRGHGARGCGRLRKGATQRTGCQRSCSCFGAYFESGCARGCERCRAI